MAGRLWKPPVGTMVWFVAEHLYYVPGHAAPEMEYSVYQGEVKGYRVGNWTDVNLKYRCEEGHIKLADVVLSADRPKIFDNPKDAALLAKEKTDDYLKHWGWVWHMWPDTPPMRRAWEKYLRDGGVNDDHEQP